MINTQDRRQWCYQLCNHYFPISNNLVLVTERNSSLNKSATVNYKRNVFNYKRKSFNRKKNVFSHKRKPLNWKRNVFSRKRKSLNCKRNTFNNKRNTRNAKRKSLNGKRVWLNSKRERTNYTRVRPNDRRGRGYREWNCLNREWCRKNCLNPDYSDYWIAQMKLSEPGLTRLLDYTD